MVQKRPYEEEEVFRISYKHARQSERTKELVSFSDGSELLQHSLEVECEENPSSCEVSSPGCFQFPIFQQCSGPRHPMNEIYNLLMVHHAPAPPRKTIPIGPDHQAEIPPFEGTSLSSSDEDQRRKGKCIISPPSEPDSRAGLGRADCTCTDRDSLGCVRKHVNEAREGLLASLGPEAFEGLGFRNMGEEVALRWSKGEEREFQRLVFSNPASSGSNFWAKLSEAFPYMARAEIVSYYFNVFMLRKRASQNRCNPASTDSDNDDDDDDEADETLDLNSNPNKANDYPYPYRFGGQVDEKEMVRGQNRQMKSENGFGGYILEQCYPKDWDSTAFVTSSESKVDFLPTCNVIEEVFW